jgi:tetratricopeptide (TPR) repeat protein
MRVSITLWQKRSAIRSGDRARDRRAWDDARDAYAEALRLDPSLSHIWVQYGNALKELQRLDDAEAAYRRALDAGLAIADTYLQLGHVLKLQGNTDAAASAYQRATELDPRSVDAALELAHLRSEAAAAGSAAAIRQRDAAVAERDLALAARDSVVSERDAALAVAALADNKVADAMRAIVGVRDVEWTQAVGRLVRPHAVSVDPSAGPSGRTLQTVPVVSPHAVSVDPSGGICLMVPVLQNFIERGLLADPAGRTIWDLGCGDGIFSDAFLELGATKVIGSDLQDLVPRRLLDNPRFNFVCGDFAAARDAFGTNGLIPADIVYMHLMSEHVFDLRGFLRELSALLGKGSELLLHHGSYYEPVGHHDHQFLFLDRKTWITEPQGVRCWESPDRCQLSLPHREQMSKGYQWSEASEATRDVSDCTSCNYFRRSRPWAHLIYASEFTRTFPEVWFRDNLNKLTNKQVLWLTNESGFNVLADARYYVMNECPDDLAARYSREELLALAYTIRAIKE